MTTEETFAKIKDIVHTVLPEAKVILFGSRASDTATDESDWDLLILDKSLVDRAVKRSVQDALFPYSLQIGSFINIVVANDKQWNENPAYYSLKLSLSSKPSIS
jgi:predicted nucleotidyltransferase